MSLTYDHHRENAEVYTDPLICMKKSLELLEEINLPRGILPLEDVIEVGRNHETGLVWLKQKKETDHCVKKIKKTVTFAAEVTSFVENRRLKNITGVKTKELAFWVNVSDISIKDPQSKKITFAIPSGIKRLFPVSAFESEEEENSIENDWKGENKTRSNLIKKRKRKSIRRTRRRRRRIYPSRINEIFSKLSVDATC